MQSAAAEGLRHLAVVGESVLFAFGIDDFAVGYDFEDTILALDQSYRGIEFLFQLGRQTGGAWVVVSLHAVFN